MKNYNPKGKIKDYIDIGEEGLDGNDQSLINTSDKFFQNFIFEDNYTKKKISMKDLNVTYSQLNQSTGQQNRSQSQQNIMINQDQSLSNMTGREQQSMLKNSFMLKQYQKKNQIKLFQDHAILQLGQQHKQRMNNLLDKQQHLIRQKLIEQQQQRVNYILAQQQINKIEKLTMHNYLSGQGSYNPKVKKIGIVSLSKMNDKQRKYFEQLFYQQKNGQNQEENDEIIDQMLNSYKTDRKIDKLNSNISTKRKGTNASLSNWGKSDLFKRKIVEYNPVKELEQVQGEVLQTILNKFTQMKMVNASHLIEPKPSSITKKDLEIKDQLILKDQYLKLEQQRQIQQYQFTPALSPRSNKLLGIQSPSIQKSINNNESFSSKIDLENKDKPDIYKPIGHSQSTLNSLRLINIYSQENQIKQQNFQNQLKLPNLTPFNNMMKNKSMENAISEDQVLINQLKNRFAEKELTDQEIIFFRGVEDNDLIEITYNLNKNLQLLQSIDKNGDYPLHVACKRGYMKMVKTLLEYGADIKAKNMALKTPKDVAIYHGHRQVYNYLNNIEQEALKKQQALQSKSSLKLQQIQ